MNNPFKQLLVNVKVPPPIAFTYAVLIFLFYNQSLSGYFEGDEWYYFTHFFPFIWEWHGIFPALYKSIVDTSTVSGGGHLTPIYNGAWFLYNQIFRLNYQPYIISSILLHIANSTLVYSIAHKVTKQTLFATLAGLFFAISSVHFQAITWVMNFIPTQLSATFLLCSLYYLFKYLHSETKQRIHIFLTSIFGLCALLTKESTIILLVLIPLIILLVNKNKLTRLFWKTYVALISIYIPFRFIVPKVITWWQERQGIVSSFTPAEIGLDLYLFRALTYPIKVLVEVFIPRMWILNTTEFLTPLAYPHYGAEQSVRGTNYLMFTQTAGSDMLIYIMGTAMIIALILAIKKSYIRNDDRSIFISLTLGSTIICLSAIPLLFIATYAPAWAYVTFIDSRHLYLSSFGAALIFPHVLMYCANFFNKYRHLAAVGLLILWSGSQYNTLQSDLKVLAHMGIQRRALLETVTNDIPQLPPQASILILSDTGYYGFGPIPPFQTNLGQVLSVIYYEKKQLPELVLQSNVFAKNGLTGEGYLPFDNRGFGYFITEKNFISSALDHNLPLESLFAFTWRDETNNLTNISPDLRQKVATLRETVQQYQNWPTIHLESAKLTLRIPPDAVSQQVTPTSADILHDLKITTQQSQTEIRVHKKVINIGIYEDISFMTDSTGQTINNNSYLRNIPMVFADTQTVKITTLGHSMKYFIPTLVPNTIIEVTAVGIPSELHKAHPPTEEIISLMRYSEKK